MNKSTVLKSTLATIASGVSIYLLKKREEKLFKQEYHQLQAKYQVDLEKINELNKIE